MIDVKWQKKADEDERELAEMRRNRAIKVAGLDCNSIFSEHNLDLGSEIRHSWASNWLANARCTVQNREIVGACIT